MNNSVRTNHNDVYLVLDRPWRKGSNLGSFVINGTTVHWISREVFDRAINAARPRLREASSDTQRLPGSSPYRATCD